jgi:hypothetical protein
MAKVKVFNRNKFDIGVKLMNPVREQNIKAGSFTIMDEDDVYYLDTICTLFKRAMLVIDNEEVNTELGFVEKNPNTKTDSEIKTILNGNFLKMKKELSLITEPHTIDLVYNTARSIAKDMSGTKLKYISQYCGRPILLDEIDE